MRKHPAYQFIRGAVTHCPPDWEWVNPGGEDAYNLWLITAGRGWMRVGEVEREIVAGDCFLLRMWEPCHGRHDRRHPLMVPWIVFRRVGDLSVSGTRDAGMPVVYRRLQSLPFMTELIERGVRTFLQDPSASSDGYIWLEAALAALLQEDAAACLSGPAELQRRKIRAICDRIRREPEATVRVEDLAEECHYSPDHFARVFRSVMGEAPRAFMTRTRIEAACGLLAMSSQSIGEIAQALQFADAAHFSREFKRHVGIAPRAWRKR